MSHSLSFNAVDLSSYGLYITTSERDIIDRWLQTDLVEERSYGWTPDYVPREISLNYTVTADSTANLMTALDNIKKAMYYETDKKLIFSVIPTRYFMAKLISFSGRLVGITGYRGEMIFTCADQNAYSTSEDTNNHPINADPKVVVETNDGTVRARPVYKLTAGENIGATTVKLENTDTSDEIQWTGTLNNGDYIEVDCENWTVSKNGVVSMSSVSGEFPYLDSGDNNMQVTGLATTGTLLITYRDRYL